MTDQTPRDPVTPYEQTNVVRGDRLRRAVADPRPAEPPTPAPPEPSVEAEPPLVQPSDITAPPEEAAPAAATTLPTRIGRYRILAKLAEGGMARVYVAQRDGAPGICVLKQLLGDLEGNDIAATRFRREAHVASYLLHPNIARVSDAGDAEDGTFYIAMDFIVGKDIESMAHAMLGRQRLLPYPVTLTAITGILAGLEYAHDAVDPTGQPMSLVHRDLSPRNMMLTFDGTAKVIDFGMAKGKFDSFKTSPGMVLGTLRFVSPEQALAQQVDARSDLYSVAVVLHELLTGHMVVRPAVKPVDMMRAVVNDPVPALSSLNPNLPRALDAVIAKGLAKQAKDRWQTAGEFRAALIEAAPEWCNTPGATLGEFMREQFPEDVATCRAFLALGDVELDDGAHKTRTVMADDLRARLAVPPRSETPSESDWVRPVTMVTGEYALTTRTGLEFPEMPATANVRLHEPDLADTAEDESAGAWPPRRMSSMPHVVPMPTASAASLPPFAAPVLSEQVTAQSARPSVPPTLIVPPPRASLAPGQQSGATLPVLSRDRGGETRGIIIGASVATAVLVSLFVAWQLVSTPPEVVMVAAPPGATPGTPIPGTPTPVVRAAEGTPSGAPVPADTPAPSRNPAVRPAAAASGPSGGRGAQVSPSPRSSPEAPVPAKASEAAPASAVGGVVAMGREVLKSSVEPLSHDPKLGTFLDAVQDASKALADDQRAALKRAVARAESGDREQVRSLVALLESYAPQK